MTPEAGSRWVRDSKKEAFWKEQIALWQESGLSVRAFCKEQGIVETSFYAWRRELIIRARESGEAEAAAVAITPNSVKDGRGRNLRVCFRQTDHSPLKSLLQKDGEQSPFVPLTVVSGEESSAEEKMVPEKNSNAGRPGISLTTPHGYVITVKSSEDAMLLKSVLSILE